MDTSETSCRHPRTANLDVLSRKRRTIVPYGLLRGVRHRRRELDTNG